VSDTRRETNVEHASHPASVAPGWDDETRIERGDTGIRILLTILFAIVARVAEGVLGVVIVFSLVVALFTRRPPPRRLRELANRVIAYSYRIGRYLTYNESRVPFPFSEFPAALEPECILANESESRVFGIPSYDEDEDEDEVHR